MEKYDGIYIRNSLLDEGWFPSIEKVVTNSPDIICYQNYVLSWSTAQTNYMDGGLCMPVLQGMVNNIYFRAKNISTEVRSAKVRGYYAPLHILYNPQKWKPMTLPDQSTEVDLVWMTGSTEIPPGEVAIVRKAFLLHWVDNPREHHCMFGICQRPDGSWTSLPDKFSGNDQLWTFLREHPEMANRNVSVVIPQSESAVVKSVEFGNHDPSDRRFIVNISILSGEDTICDGSTIQIINTDSLCSFALEQPICNGKTEYSFEVPIPGKYFGAMDFICNLKKPKDVFCTLFVQNYLVLDDDEKVIVPDAVLTHLRSNEYENAVLLGDFTLEIRGGEMQNKTEQYNSIKNSSIALQQLLFNKKQLFLDD